MDTMTLRETLRRCRSEQGVTLIELMVALAAFALVSVAAFAVLSSGQKTAVLNDQTVKVQQSARLALDIMARDIRMAGFGNAGTGGALPLPCATPIVAVNNPNASDQISLATIGQQVGILTQRVPPPGNVTANQIFVTFPTPIVVGDVITIEGVFTKKVFAVNTGTGQIDFDAGAPFIGTTIDPMVFPPGTAVMRLSCVTYSVSGPNPAPPQSPYQLLRQVGPGPQNVPVPVVDGIETIQLAYGLDSNGDDRIDDQPGPGIFQQVDCLDYVPNNTPCRNAPAPAAPIGPGTQAVIPIGVNSIPTFVRQIRLTVVARAIPPANANIAGNCWRDPSFTGRAAIQAEDQFLPEPVQVAPCPAPLLTGGIRRRVLTRVISLRDVTQ
jgi:type IV pilus assembly protein PilW